MKTRRMGAAVAAAAVVLLTMTPPISATSEPTVDGQVVYTSTRDGNHDIYLRAADGSERKLAATSADEIDPQLSPDGRHVVFTRSGDVFVVGVDAAPSVAGTNLTDDAAFDGFPTWRPDGAWIAWVSSKDTGRPAASASADLWIARVGPERATLSDRVRLTTRQAGASGPSWSSRDEIAFAMRVGTGYQVFVVDLAMTPTPSAAEPEQLTRGRQKALAPAFSPDGSRIAYHVLVRPDLPDVYVMDADGSRSVNVTSSAKTVEAFPVWSPKPGDPRLLVAAGRDASSTRLALLDLTTRELSPAFTPGPGDRAPHWGAVLPLVAD